MTIARMIVRCEASNETACILTIANWAMTFQKKEIQHIMSSSLMQCIEALEYPSYGGCMYGCMRARRNGHVVSRTVHVFGALA